VCTVISPQNMDLIGVRFDGSGRAVGQSGAPQALRAAGLLDALPSATLTVDIDAGAGTSERGRTGFINESALVAMVEAVRKRVTSTLAAGRFPVIYGGDCAVLLGAILALGAADGPAGLLFIDAHEDATSAEHSDGEAANSEIALLLGTYGGPTPPRLGRFLPAIDPDNVVLVGQRDAGYRRNIGMPSIAGDVPFYSERLVHANPASVARRALADVSAGTSSWWLHVDLDVVAGDQFGSCSAATDPGTPGGLSWAELATIAGAALEHPGCRGLSTGVYNTDLDPHRRDAERVVQFLGSLIPASSRAIPSS
jgi:arginase